MERAHKLLREGRVQGVGWALAGHLHGLVSGLAVQGPPGGAALEQAVEVAAAATTVHGGDAGGGGGA